MPRLSAHDLYCALKRMKEIPASGRRLWRELCTQTPGSIQELRIRLRGLRKGASMKRLAVLAVCFAVAGYLFGDLVQATGAMRTEAQEILKSKSEGDAALPKAKVRRVGSKTSEVAPRDGEEAEAALVANEDLPPEIRKAREQGAKARQDQLKEILYNLKHGIGVAKDRGWGMGGPYFPMGSFVQPREKPVRLAAGTFSMAAPFDVAGPLSGALQIGPGDPSVVPHQRFVENISPPIPEPGTWALLILGFAALAWRLKSQRRLSA